MKNKNFTSVSHLIGKQIKRKCFPFMDFGEIERLKYPKTYQFPIKDYYNKEKSDIFKTMLLISFLCCLPALLVLILYIIN